MTLAQLRASLALWRRRERARKELHTVAQRDLDNARAFDRHPRQHLVERRDLRSRQLREAREMVALRERQIAERTRYEITTVGGARGIVDQAFQVARLVGGGDLYVGSSFRPGDITTSGYRSDHSGNDHNRAARDIGRHGYDLLWGPPTPELDKAAVAIGRAFDRGYGDGRRTVIDTFNWRGYRIQVIWRTPKFGGHLGHIHVGARRL